MQIEISPVDVERLTQHALAAGYDDVERYVTEHVRALAHCPTTAELPPLTDEELAASLAVCDRSMTEAKEGKGNDFRDALSRMSGKHGLDRTQ